MFAWYDHMSGEAVVLLSLAAILLAGFLATRITKRLSLPNVSGYIIAGIVIGPSCLGIIPQETIAGMGFVSDVALAFIAFGAGRFFKREKLRRTGAKVIWVTLFEALLAGVLVTLCMYCLFHLDLEFSVLLGAIATATAPASTMMTIDQYHARGPFVDLLLEIVAFDDVVCLLVFSAAAAFIDASAAGTVSPASLAGPVLLNILMLLVGAVFGVVLSRILAKRSNDNRLILAVALVLGLSGLCSMVDVSPLLSCMVFGAVYINLTRDKALYRQINTFTPPIMTLFFVVSGMNLRLEALAAFGVIGVAYFFIRIVGKYAGAWLGCAVTGMERSTRNYLGGALVPQAGVAIGLAYLGQRILPARYGELLMTIILSSSVLYELIGPACAKFSLFRAGAIQPREPEPVTPPVRAAS